MGAAHGAVAVVGGSMRRVGGRLIPLSTFLNLYPMSYYVLIQELNVIRVDVLRLVSFVTSSANVVWLTRYPYVERHVK